MGGEEKILLQLLLISQTFVLLSTFEIKYKDLVSGLELDYITIIKYKDLFH